MAARLFLILTLAGFLNASEETAQVFPPRPIDWRAQARALTQQNADLRKIVQTLEPYREMVAYLQQRLADAEQSSTQTQQGAASLMQANKAQAVRDKQQIDRLQHELQAATMKCRESEAMFRMSENTLSQERLERQQLQSARNQIEIDLQQNKNRLAQDERLIQFLRERAETQQKENQSLQTALENCEKQLRSKMEPGQSQNAGMDKKVLNLRQELDDNRLSLETAQRQNENLIFENSNLKKQLQSQSKRLENYEQTFLETISETQALQTRFQSLIDEKSQALEKWRQANTSLQTQLDSAAAINTQLRQQIANLQAECEKKPTP